MNLAEFFNIIQKYGDASFAIPVLKDFLATPNTPDLTNFFDLYKQDKRLASAVDSKKYAKVIGKILDDHKSYGGDPATITSALQKNPDKMTISSMDIRNLNIPVERNHKFVINVSGTLLYDVVDKIYDFAKESDYNLDMELPAAKFQKLGYTDTIVLYSSNENLYSTLQFIKKLETLHYSFGEQPSYFIDRERGKYYTEVVEGIAYDSYNPEFGKWSRDIVGETIIEAIDNMIVNFVADNFELYGNADYVNYKNNRVKFIRDMMDQGIEVYNTFNTYLEQGFIEKNIDPDNIYLSDDVREKFLGPRIVVTENIETSFEEQRDLEDVIERMTQELLGQSGDDKEDKEDQVTPEDILTYLSEYEEEGEHVVEHSNEGGDEEKLIEDGGDEFVPLTSQIERANPEDNKVLGLKPVSFPLNPLDYVVPSSPTANLRRLDELDRENVVASSLEQEISGGSEQELEESKTKEGTIGRDVVVETSEEISGEETEEEVIPEVVLGEEAGEEVIPEVVPGEEAGEEVIPEVVLGEEAGEEVIPEVVPGEESGEEVIPEVVPGEEAEEEVIPEEIFAGEQSTFGEKITVPSEGDGLPDEGLNSGDAYLEEEKSIIQQGDVLEEQVVEDQNGGEQAIDELGSVFGATFLSDLMREAGESVIEEEKGTNISDALEESQEEQVIPDGPVIEEQQAEESPTMSLLREYQERRAAEMAESAESQAELMRLMESSINDQVGRNIPSEVRPGEEYLDRLLEEAQSEGAALEEESEKIEPEDVVSEKLDDKTGETAIVVSSRAIEKSEAERYLDSLVEKAQNASNVSAFGGFDTNMISIEDKANEVVADLTPSALFEENVARVEASESEKSPAEKRIDEMLAALEAKRNNQSSVKMEDMPRTKYEHVKSEQERAMDKLLEDAINGSSNGDFVGFDEEMFNTQSAVDKASEGLGLSSNEAYQNYSSTQGPKRPEEEKYDAMLRGDIKLPEVVIEPITSETVVKREASEEEVRMTQMLENLGKETPAVVGEYVPLPRPVYQQVKSNKEQELDDLLANALVPKEPVLGSIRDEMKGTSEVVHEVNENESYLDKLLDSANHPPEDGEFTGFSAENLDEQVNYLEVASDPQELFAITVQEEKEKDQGQGETPVVNEHESYLQSLLDSAMNQPQDEQDKKADEEILEEPATYVHVPTEEEIRLAELEQNALLPQAPLLEEKVADTEAEKEAEGEKVVKQEEVSAEESYLDRLLDQSLGDENITPDDNTFTGFDGDMIGGTAVELVGPQGLLELSLEEKIQQVAEMERNKTPEERRMDGMLRGEYKEKPAVVVEDMTMTPPPQGQKENATESYLESLLSDLSTIQGSEENTGFSGFDEEMLDAEESEVVKTAQELFAEEVPVAVSQIGDATVKGDALEQHLVSLSELVPTTEVAEKVGGSEDLLDGLEEIPSEQENGELLSEEGIFKGFGTEEVFFDDEIEEQTEEDSLAAAMANVTLMTLDSLDELTQEEQKELLHMDNLRDERVDNYTFLFGDSTEEIMETVVVDQDGREMRIIDYLEENNVLTLLPEDAQVIVNGESMTRDDFIRNSLIPYLLSNGCVSLFDYINDNEIDVKYAETKGGFFRGL